MVIKGNVLETHSVEEGIKQGSPVSQILFAMYTSGPIELILETISQLTGMTLDNDVRWVVICSNLSQIIRKLDGCAKVSINWVEKQ